MIEPAQQLASLRKQMLGILAEAFRRGRDSMSGTAGNKAAAQEQSGAALIACMEDVDRLHAEYAAFARAQVEAAQAKAKEKK